MTLKERVIVETYTGFCMTSGEERAEVYKYAAELMGRPVFTHELADVAIMQRLRELSREDFINLCRFGTDEYKIKAVSESIKRIELLSVEIGKQFGKATEELKKLAFKMNEVE